MKEFLIKLNNTGKTKLYMTTSEHEVPVFTMDLDYAIRTQNIAIAGALIEMHSDYDLTIEMEEK